MSRLICASMQENLTLLHVKNKGADQPAHPCNLVSAFVIPCMESIVAKHTPRKISIF